jgi:hypothetical protein
MPYNHRYYLHQKVRKSGFCVIALKRLVYVREAQAEKAQNNWHIKELGSKYSYSIQYLNPLTDKIQ